MSFLMATLSWATLGAVVAGGVLGRCSVGGGACVSVCGGGGGMSVGVGGVCVSGYVWVGVGRWG